MRALFALALVISGNLPQLPQNTGPEITGIEPRAALTTPGAKIIVAGTNLSPDSTVYFGGFEVRELAFINSTTLQVVTPYLRPGSYAVHVKSGGKTIQWQGTFTAFPASVDSEVDHAGMLAERGQPEAAVGILNNIAESFLDYQVRAYARYRSAQVYMASGDYWRAAGEAALIWNPKAGISIQTSWRYRLLDEETTYALSESTDHEADLRLAEWAVEKDVTENPEPRFFRALVNARFGNMAKARADSAFILKSEPNNAAYLALAAYIALLEGDKSRLEASAGEELKDVRAASLLGQAAYIAGDTKAAQDWWAIEAKLDRVGAKLAYWTGKKHLTYGQIRVASALLAECSTISPESTEGKQARELLAGIAGKAH
jgi:hypothetical protein